MKIKQWTLWLDRDGVINLPPQETAGTDYVLRWADFEFFEGALEGLAALSMIFRRIFVVTNQQGVGKGLMSAADLADIHTRMCEAVRAAGGCIDAVYAATELATGDFWQRKPYIGMALQAKREFSDIDFEKSVMLGDSERDLQFAENAGIAQSVFVDRALRPAKEAFGKEKYNRLLVVRSLREFAALCTERGLGSLFA